VPKRYGGPSRYARCPGGIRMRCPHSTIPSSINHPGQDNLCSCTPPTIYYHVPRNDIHQECALCTQSLAGHCMQWDGALFWKPRTRRRHHEGHLWRHPSRNSEHLNGALRTESNGTTPSVKSFRIYPRYLTAQVAALLGLSRSTSSLLRWPTSRP
jgi:hypothetical protein